MVDDATLLTLMDRDSLLRVREILSGFEILSGLACNVEKTTLMQFGVNDPIPDEIENLGFDIKNEVKLLGLKIKNDCNSYILSKSELEERIRSQIRFWTRFDLSLPGRVTMAKTFMYSQLNYIGCFLPIEQEWVDLFENMVETYVKGLSK